MYWSCGFSYVCCIYTDRPSLHHFHHYLTHDDESVGTQNLTCRMLKGIFLQHSIFIWSKGSMKSCNLFLSASVLGYCIRGLMTGMATLPQGNQALLVVRDKSKKTPGELGVSKSMKCDIFPSVLWHCWLGHRKGCKKLGVGLLVVMI